MSTDNDKYATTESGSVEEDKALIMEMNQLISDAVQSAVLDNREQEPRKYLVYYDSHMKGRSLYLILTDKDNADNAARHIDKYLETANRASVVEVDLDAPVDEVPRYDSSESLYRDYWY